MAAAPKLPGVVVVRSSLQAVVIRMRGSTKAQVVHLDKETVVDLKLFSEPEDEDRIIKITTNLISI
jgi:hypothetical protein